MPTPVASCRLCRAPLPHAVIDLGATPLANAYLRQDDLGRVEAYYPLRAYLCEQCLLLQLEAVAAPESIFGHYAYFSSFSRTLLHHSEQFANGIIDRLRLKPGAKLVEIASNDGYLLQFFQARGLDVLGVEPARNIAAAAVARGIPTVSRFFGTEVAAEIALERGKPVLIVANNVVAHVPDLNDFIGGVKVLLAPGGTLTLEFHHALCLVEQAQFDNIYHEHFQYFSLASAKNALAAHGMKIVDVEELPTQGGSIRVYAAHAEDLSATVSPRVEAMLVREAQAGLANAETYRALAVRIAAIKLALLEFLVSAKQAGKSVVCFGAAAKGNTLLNYCGVHADLVDYAVDSSPHKQGLFLPGSRIPIHGPSRIDETRPDYVLILPWNLCQEITAQMAGIREWGGQFVVAVPELRVLR